MVKTWPFTIFLFKARTTKEVRDYLTKYEIDSGIIDKVVQHLKEDKWLDDRQYARNLIEANLLSGDKGPSLITTKNSTKRGLKISPTRNTCRL